MWTPVIRLSDSARRALQEAAVDAGGDPLRIQISDRFEYDLFFGSRAEDDLDVDRGGMTIRLDPSSRTDGPDWFRPSSHVVAAIPTPIIGDPDART